MKKRILAVILCVCLVFAVTACSSGDGGSSSAPAPAPTESGGDTAAPQGDTLKIAYFGGGMQATWLQNVLKALTEMGQKNGYEVINADAEWDGDKMLSQIDTLIDQGIDGASIFLVDMSIGKAAFDKFQAAGVPVAFETLPFIDADGKFLAPGITADPVGMGQVPEAWVRDNLEALGFDKDDFSKTGLMLGTNQIFQETDDRAQEFRKAFELDFPNFPKENIFVNDVAADPNRPDDTEGSYTQAMTLLTANPQIEQWLIFATVDDYAVGIARALEANDLQSHAKMISVGGERAIPEWISNPAVNEYWVAELYFNAMQYAEIVDEALMGMIREGKDPKDVLTQYKAPGQDFGVYMMVGDMVTPETYEDYYLPGY